MRSMFNAAFKTNPCLERALMTGITRVSKESIFSDLNNMDQRRVVECGGYSEVIQMDACLRWVDSLGKDRNMNNIEAAKERRRGYRMALAQEKVYTIDDIYALPDGERAELIDGQIYNMAPPKRIHQKLVSELTQIIGNHIKSQKGECEIYPAPFAVFLNGDDKTYVEPDISVICDKNKLNDQGCFGAPDWIIEIVSPGTERMDYGIKLFKYRSAKVREYWIINPSKKAVMVYDFEYELDTKLYSFDDTIPVCIYQDLKIDIADLL